MELETVVEVETEVVSRVVVLLVDVTDDVDEAVVVVVVGLPDVKLRLEVEEIVVEEANVVDVDDELLMPP